MASEVRGLGIDAVLLEPGAVSSDGPAGAPSYVDPDGACGPPAADVAGLRREPMTVDGEPQRHHAGGGGRRRRAVRVGAAADSGREFGAGTARGRLTVPARSRSSMIVAMTDDDRIGPPLTGGERDTLRAWLDYHRATLARKCAGLSDEQLRERSMTPSTLTLLGLVRHLAEVERTWFRRVFEDHTIPLVWSDTMNFQAAYDPDGCTGARAFTAWEAEVTHARAIEQASESLDRIGYQPRWEQEVSLRYVMTHVLLEYARHNGHADLIREGVDGVVGA